MNKTKPLCPGCGKPMECSIPHLHVYETVESLRYICGYGCESYKCGWRAPLGRGETREAARKDAYNKAIRRAMNEDGRKA